MMNFVEPPSSPVVRRPSVAPLLPGGPLSTGWEPSARLVHRPTSRVIVVAIVVVFAFLVVVVVVVGLYNVR